MKKFIPTTEFARRFHAMFKRKSTTGWSEKEVKAYKKLLPIDPEEFGLLERYYRVCWPPSHGQNVLRCDLTTLLNNFTGEVDRARIWCAKHPPKSALPAPRKIIPLPVQPEQQMSEDERARFEAEFRRLMGRDAKLR